MRDLSPPGRRRGPAAAREAMSVMSGNYARVPVAIGLLILLGARWACCSLLAPRTRRSRPRTTRRGVRPWLVAVKDGSGLS